MKSWFWAAAAAIGVWQTDVDAVLGPGPPGSAQIALTHQDKYKGRLTISFIVQTRELETCETQSVKTDSALDVS